MFEYDILWSGEAGEDLPTVADLWRVVELCERWGIEAVLMRGGACGVG